MAMTGNHSPRHSSDNLQSRRAARLHASPPWNQVVRGESDSVAAAPSQLTEDFPSAAAPVDDFSSASAESSDNGAGKRPVWNKPSPNGATAAEVRPVMDALSWPALSESTRAAMKSESSSSKGLLDGSSLPQLQGLGSASSSSSSQREVSDNASTNSVVPARQKSMKHHSSNASSNGGHPQQSVAAPQVSIAATGSHNSSPKDHTQRSGFGSNDHPQQRNSFRNRNGGPHQRGDGSHHHNYGNRRDQDWNNNRSFSGRDTHVSPRAVPRFIRPPPPPPPNSAQFFHPSPIRPFGGHIGFHELATPLVFVAAPPPPPDSLRGVPFGPPIPHHPMFFAGPDPQLHSKIVNQIDYYFSNENLIKDTFLRQNMDDQGWVPIKLIAGFNKVMHLTDNIQIILDAVRTSSVVEVQVDKIRRRNDWRRWVMAPPIQFSNATTLGVLNPDMLAEQMHNIALETSNFDGAGGLDPLSDTSQHSSTFGDLSNPLQHSTSEGTG
ncbi:la-related protein 1C [Cajanus cajan]|uniref:La-related protein 1 n=1 Tax=Cajanus cajan TaxID=3821 RepID=A0A151THT9_CAJCA|nr:la-related protein 1C [Cajanus cajan]KYP66624.1 La-related protein 1 [Cajanus cajan]